MVAPGGILFEYFYLNFPPTPDPPLVPPFYPDEMAGASGHRETEKFKFSIKIASLMPRDLENRIPSEKLHRMHSWMS